MIGGIGDVERSIGARGHSFGLPQQRLQRGSSIARETGTGKRLYTVIRVVLRVQQSTEQQKYCQTYIHRKKPSQ
jgi:hypothetical protein